MRRLRLIVGIVLASVAVTALVTQAGPRPDRIPLPDGFQPEGIAIGRDANFYVGSIPTGAIYRGSLRTHKGSVFVRGGEGRSAIGLSFDRNRLFVAGGDTGKAYVYSARSGNRLASYGLTEKPTFVNDVVATTRAAWFTDSLNPVLYRVPIRRNGDLGGKGSVVTVRLTGDIRYLEGFNVNGIDATRDGTKLVIVQSNTGKLFTVSPRSGRTREIDLGGAKVTNGDGLLLDGRRLFVVQNAQNLIAVVELAPRLGSGEVVRRLRDEDFDVPTTVADMGNQLYVVNARFTTPPTPESEYWTARRAKPAR
jgi:sugar lactone lactonase YvrE